MKGTCGQYNHDQKITVYRDNSMDPKEYQARVQEEYLTGIDHSSYTGMGPDGKPCADCVCVMYQGTLMQGCGNACMRQGYQIVLGKDGTVIGAVPTKPDGKHELRLMHQKLGNIEPKDHVPLSDEEWARLLEYGNDEAKLNEVYQVMKNPEQPKQNCANPEGYAAKISQCVNWGPANFKQAGNSVATFLVQLSRAREALGLRQGLGMGWPIYDGQLPLPKNEVQAPVGGVTPEQGTNVKPNIAPAQ